MKGNKLGRATLGNKISLFFLSIITIVFIFPFYWIMTGAFKLQKVTIALPPQWFPLEPTLKNYEKLFNNPALKWLYNSVAISLIAMLLVCLVASLAGYALAKKKFIGQGIIFGLFIAAMALPKQVVLVPLVRLLNTLKIYDSMWAVILPSVGWPFGVFLMKQFTETLPSELLEAARIDGCSELQIYKNIVLPIVKPGFAALAIYTFITTWNDYALQLVMLTSRENLTLALGVATLQLEFSTNYGVIMAGASLAAVPIVTVFILFQKYFTQGITMGAVKG